MKTIFTAILSIAFIFNAQAQYRNLEIQAAGLTCSLCSNAIQKAVKALPFVADVQTELKSNTFRIDLRPGVPVDFDLLSKKVEDAGFSVGRMTVDVNFGKLDIKNDLHTTVGNHAFHFVNVKPTAVQGWQKVRLLDKNFVLSSEHKKNSKLSQMECFKTGVMASCCSSQGIRAGQRVYHVTI